MRSPRSLTRRSSSRFLSLRHRTPLRSADSSSSPPALPPRRPSPFRSRVREIFGDKGPVNWATREEGEAAVEAALLAFTGPRGPIYKKRRRGQGTSAEDTLMDGAPLHAIDEEGARSGPSSEPSSAADPGGTPCVCV